MKFKIFLSLIFVFVAGFSGGFFVLFAIIDGYEAAPVVYSSPVYSGASDKTGGDTLNQEFVDIAESEQVDQPKDDVLEGDNNQAGAIEKLLEPVAAADNKMFLGSGTVLAVPFISQAPLGDWKDQRQQDGCEEASVIMAMLWARNEPALAPADALKEILAVSDYEKDKFGDWHDTSVWDTGERIIKGYFGYDKFVVKYDFSAADIRNELLDGNLVIVPADGRVLKNPFYTAPGPERHMLVIKGYDGARGEFITNDPGTKHGENYRYSENILMSAIRDYPSGWHEPNPETRKAMIVIFK